MGDGIGSPLPPPKKKQKKNNNNNNNKQTNNVKLIFEASVQVPKKMQWSHFSEVNG